ncbi:transcription-repair coupling factor [Peredibacter sp. HCB2-198]|uniref:transcription-repair coupling factor n=1 Tax=Peredibacter sp. HCB2-198 TaxID=3383025 RepID=UPI0038B4CAA2
MTLFSAIATKIQYWLQNQQELSLKGVSPNQWCLLAGSYFSSQLFNSTHLIVCSDQDEAEEVFESLKHLKNVHFYPGHNHSLYSSIMTSESALLARWSVLQRLQNNSVSIIVTTHEASVLLGPDRGFFQKNSFSIKKDDIISPFDLAKKLTDMGYFPASTIEEPGTFSRRGEIFDIYPISHPPVRLQYFDDLIEEIFSIDLETQKTVRETTYNELALVPGAGYLTKDPYATMLRSRIPQAQPAFKNKYEARKQLLSRVSENQLFENYPLYIPLFFEKPETLIDFLPANAKITFINNENGQKNLELFLAGQAEDFEDLAEDVESSSVIPAIENFYLPQFPKTNLKTLFVDQLDIAVNLDTPFDKELHLNFEKLKSYLQTKLQISGSVPDNKYEYIKGSLKVLRKELNVHGHLVVNYKSENARQELQYLLEENKLTEIGTRLQFVYGKLDEGFYYKNENIFVLSEGDFFSVKKKKTKQVKATNKDLFAEQLATLKINDYVIHRDHGIGIYKGLETIQTGDQQNDYLVILYEDNDKVYVPVYKLNLVQKHADSSSGLKVASLKSKKFAELKTKARGSVKKLAFDLLKLQAERKLRGGYPYSPPDHLFKEFELSFAFEETPDQSKAIQDVLDDMQQQYPMDRLVCGDVGFGKTEVAMRAAMKAVLDKKQVVLLVPTTVLALQHYHSFKKRFENFPVNVDMISRFKTAKQKNETMGLVAEGKVDILIGTHAVLSDKLEFHDLGLLIIDEEHRFGVAHKEKLKVLKTGVDVLTMTATPIPRTLQLSFLGIRDLSLIQTAPPRRQAIKTYIIKEDDLTLKSAIEKELSRGGQIYYVHNRVHDIEEHEIYLKKLVPSARISVTHGQMNERELEKRINDFYDHKSDILLATTIIESGIDIPNANTMIIDRADTYGLAQLHQLRGRIGRSDRKAYAYFIVPENRVISETAQRRLHALQTYAEMGSGFALASSDMEIRGAGDILGAEQSGHIEAIGLEFYMDLLQEAIQEIRGEQKVSVKNIEIQAPFSAYIPNGYIPDHALRLKYYKRLSNCSDLNRLEDIITELNDAFGMTPKELEALYSILRSRIIFQPLGLRLVKVGGTQIALFFDQEILNHNHQLRDKMLNFFMNKPKLYKINPDSSVNALFKETVSHNTLLEFAKHIAANMGV